MLQPVGVAPIEAPPRRYRAHTSRTAAPPTTFGPISPTGGPVDSCRVCRGMWTDCGRPSTPCVAVLRTGGPTTACPQPPWTALRPSASDLPTAAGAVAPRRRPTCPHGLHGDETQIPEQARAAGGPPGRSSSRPAGAARHCFADHHWWLVRPGPAHAAAGLGRLALCPSRPCEAGPRARASRIDRPPFASKQPPTAAPTTIHTSLETALEANAKIARSGLDDGVHLKDRCGTPD